jgi:hydrogenase expression/formation protein HypE
MSHSSLPIGKLPSDLLRDLLGRLPTESKDILLGPGIGLDCAVIQPSGELLVVKSDPITFAMDQIGWYTVQINVNDLATTGALPRWMTVVALLPEENARLWINRIADQLQEACHSLDLVIVGGHTEITHGIDRPILVGTLIGEVSRDRLVTPRGARPGDRLLLTKGVPIEATAILAREFTERLAAGPAELSPADLTTAQNFLYNPGISVLSEARTALEIGGVHAMHDPTEGGLYTALWEMAEASGRTIWVDLTSIPVFPLSRRICNALGLDPLAAIASGALLLAIAPEKSVEVAGAIARSGIECKEIGQFVEEPGPPVVRAGRSINSDLLPRPVRDEIAQLF